MARLSDFKGYLKERRKVLRRAEERLCKLQEKYEEFFGEISTTREAELQQLRGHILADRAALPADFNRELDAAIAAADAELTNKIRQLEKDRDAELKSADERQAISIRQEKAMRGRNLELDEREEALKARSEALLAEIADHNRRIREMGRGFGFFKNLFAMRRMQRQRVVLDEKQADVAARIEATRAQWVELDQAWAAEEHALRQAWVQHTTEADALQTKITHLEASRSRIVERSAIEKVLFTRAPARPSPTADGTKCPRCKWPNPKESHFCNVCARRLVADRPDFSGSLLEIAELNQHFESFSAGMKACQEIIGLVRGLGSGLESFTKSVDDLITTEGKYPLPKLAIDVPKSSVTYGQNFDELEKAAAIEHSLHPAAFAEQVQQRVKSVYTEGAIKGFFETMGDELGRQAKGQWG